MGLSTKNIIGIKVTIISKKKVLEEIRKYLKKVKSQKSKVQKKGVKPLVIFTPNPEIVAYAQKDGKFKQIVNSAQINIADGWGMVWAAKKLFKMTIEKISGTDLMLDLARLASGKGYTVGLIGGRGGVALATAECLRKKLPGIRTEVFDAPDIKVSGIRHKASSMMNNNAKKILNTKYLILNTRENQIKETESYFITLVNELGKKNVDILFVALGFPKQELFIDSVKRKALSVKHDRPLVIMTVGGAFDYLSSKVPRAPKWMREKGWEWLFRLLRQPWRLKRQIMGAEFFYRVLTSS